MADESAGVKRARGQQALELPMPPHIRPMLPSDLPAMLAVQAQCYPPSMQEEGALLLARLQAAGDTCLVATDGDSVCAYLFAYLSVRGAVTDLGAPFAPAARPDTLYLHDLAVAPRAHGQGLARRLADHLLARGREHGLDWAALVSVQDTARFWAGLGFRSASARPAAPGHGLASYPEGALYMERALLT